MENIEKVPVHVSIIMDGNGRWAGEHGMERAAGHIEGVESVRACTEAAVKYGVKYLSLYAFSEENSWTTAYALLSSGTGRDWEMNSTGR